MTEDEKFSAILDSLPEKPHRSRLEPYRGLITELRRRGRSYREIERILVEQCQVRAPRSTINDFVRARSRAIAKSKTRQKPSGQAAFSSGGAKSDPRSTSQQIPDEIQKRIAALKRRPIQKETEPKLFHYDPDEPLDLRQKTGSESTRK